MSIVNMSRIQRGFAFLAAFSLLMACSDRKDRIKKSDYRKLKTEMEALKRANQAKEKTLAEQLASAQAEMSKLKDQNKAAEEARIAADQKMLEVQTAADQKVIESQDQMRKADEMRTANELESARIEEARKTLESAQQEVAQAKSQADASISENNEKLKILGEEILRNETAKNEASALVEEQQRLLAANEATKAAVEGLQSQLATEQEKFRAHMQSEREKFQNEMARIKAETDKNAMIARSGIWFSPSQRVFDLMQKNPDVAVPVLVSFKSAWSVTKARLSALSLVREAIMKLNQNEAYKKTWVSNGQSVSAFGFRVNTGSLSTGADDKFLIQAKPGEVKSLMDRYMGENNDSVFTNGEKVDISDFNLDVALVDKVRVFPTLFVYNLKGELIAELPLKHFVAGEEVVLSPDVNFKDPITYVFGEESRTCRLVTVECVSFLKSKGYLEARSNIDFAKLPSPLAKEKIGAGAAYAPKSVRVSAQEMLKSLASESEQHYEAMVAAASPGQTGGGAQIRDPRSNKDRLANPSKVNPAHVISEIMMGFNAEFYDSQREGLRTDRTTTIPLVGADTDKVLMVNGQRPVGEVQNQTFFSELLGSLQ